MLAKPAEQTPADRVRGGEAVPRGGPAACEALHLLTGDGKVGGKLTGDPRCGGVAFTGSTEVARIINRTLAAKDGPDRAADRGDGRAQRAVLRHDGAARAGGGRRHHVGLPLGGPALLGAARAVPAA